MVGDHANIMIVMRSENSPKNSLVNEVLMSCDEVIQAVYLGGRRGEGG